MIVYLLIVLLLLVLYDRFNRSGRLMRKIPGPRVWPIVGNTLGYALPPDKFLLFLRFLTAKYGDIFQIHALNMRIVHISNLEDIEKILSSSKFNNKRDPYRFLKPWIGEGLLTSNGVKWQQRRKMLTKAFHFSILKKFVETFKNRAEDFVKRVEKETAKEQTDLLAFICPTALRIMCETSMGISMGEDIAEIKKFFKSIQDFGEIFIYRVTSAWLHNDYIYNLTKYATRQKHVVNDLCSFTNDVIKKRRKLLDTLDSGNEGGEKLALLNILLEVEKSGQINSDGVQEEVDTFLFEGFDTSSVLMTFMLMALANEPVVQEKIFQEMDMIFGDSQRSPSIEDLNEMKYLECCIKETLRLYPSVPAIARQISEETELSGYTVPANTDFYILIYELHHRADLYPDPEKFDPDRFLPENSKNRHPYAFLPFSAGPRNCIGQKFAMQELKVIMSSVFRKFRLEPVTRPSDLKFKADMVLRTTEPVYVRFRPRRGSTTAKAKDGQINNIII